MNVDVTAVEIRSRTTTSNGASSFLSFFFFLYLRADNGLAAALPLPSLLRCSSVVRRLGKHTHNKFRIFRLPSHSKSSRRHQCHLPAATGSMRSSVLLKLPADDFPLIFRVPLVVLLFLNCDLRNRWRGPC